MQIFQLNKRKNFSSEIHLFAIVLEEKNKEKNMNKKKKIGNERGRGRTLNGVNGDPVLLGLAYLLACLN